MTTAGIWRRQGPEESKDSSEKRLLTPPTYLRCGVTLNFDDYGKKERGLSAAGAIMLQ